VRIRAGFVLVVLIWLFPLSGWGQARTLSDLVLTERPNPSVWALAITPWKGQTLDHSRKAWP
jgi:hypothetical protein